MVNEVKYASISVQEIFSSKLRLEASVYNVDARTAKQLVKDCVWESKTITGDEGIATAYHRGRFKRVFVENSNMPIYQPSQILEMYPKPDKFISSFTDTNIDALRVKNGQLLLTCSGTIGKCTMVSKTLTDQIFSHDLIRIDVKNIIDIGYLYAFLQTEIGQTLVVTNNYGAVIDHIEPDHLNHIALPYASEILRKNINDLVVESFELRDQSYEAIKKAEELLISELKLPPLRDIISDYYDTSSKVRTYTVRLDELNNRLDGSYHNPIVNKLIDYFLDSGAEIKALKAFCKDITMPGIFKRTYVEKGHGVPFLGTTDVRELSPKTKKFLSKKAHEQLIENHLLLKENTILQFNRGSVSVGEVVFVPDYFENENWTASQNCLRIVPINNDIAGYLFVYLNSEYGNALSRREIYGAVIDMIDPTNSQQIPIPIIKDPEKVKEINSLALLANNLRSKAFYKEKEAIRIMNDEVIYKTRLSEVK